MLERGTKELLFLRTLLFLSAAMCCQLKIESLSKNQQKELLDKEDVYCLSWW